MGLANSLEKVAANIIDVFGGDVTIRYIAASSYNTTTGAITRTSTDVDVKGVVEAVSARETNDLIQAGDKRLTVAADDLTTAPETNDLVVISSVVHQIIQVNTEEHDNTAITYELILRA